MSVFEALQLAIAFGMFTLALLTLVWLILANKK
ncbi:putative holin-like toxin [Salicibibacter cibarius]|uniref:Putative holin-like toxin n=1 Tax=Salicibibacter cibarius TaxID=2743000 RepID=A0A7T6Z515_9BACI|nr:putative holin-like toxin [Salicibibacter cibarius]QQK77020.1 putative holin-like toxin [Salicibibacter cibarius]